MIMLLTMYMYISQSLKNQNYHFGIIDVRMLLILDVSLVLMFFPSVVEGSSETSAGTTTFIFSSDSEEEEASSTSYQRADKKSCDDWIIDEDDYCILSAPTTAKVVREREQ